MKSKNIHAFDTAMVESLQQMIESGNEGDFKLAMDILKNRDVNDIESEKNITDWLSRIGLNPKTTSNRPIMYAAYFRNEPLLMFGQAYYSERGSCTRTLIDYCKQLSICQYQYVKKENGEIDWNMPGKRAIISAKAFRDAMIKAKIFEIKPIKFN